MARDSVFFDLNRRYETLDEKREGRQERREHQVRVREARWTKKHERSYFCNQAVPAGCKNHFGADRRRDSGAVKGRAARARQAKVRKAAGKTARNEDGSKTQKMVVGATGIEPVTPPV